MIFQMPSMSPNAASPASILCLWSMMLSLPPPVLLTSPTLIPSISGSSQQLLLSSTTPPRVLSTAGENKTDLLCPLHASGKAFYSSHLSVTSFLHPHPQTFRFFFTCKLSNLILPASISGCELTDSCPKTKKAFNTNPFNCFSLNPHLPLSVAWCL